MGCTKSKMRVVPQQPVEAWTTPTATRKKGSVSLSNKSSESGSSSRGGSASSTNSKASTHSKDSGIGGEESTKKPEEENADLTLQRQKSRTPPPSSDHRKRLPPIIKAADKSVSMPKDVSLGPSPVQKHIAFADSLMSELPDNPNIIKRPTSRLGGMAFDIVMDDSSADSRSIPKRKPTYLQRLEGKNEPVTLRDLVEKQREAKMRREGYEQMKLERIRIQKEKDRQVAEALAKFSAMQKEVKAEVEKKMKTTLENREAHLNAVRDRLKGRSDKVEELKLKNTKKLPPLRHPNEQKDSADNEDIKERPAINLEAN